MTPEEQGIQIAAEAARSAGVRFEQGDPELDQAWAESTSAEDFERRAFDLAWARALQPLKEELVKRKSARTQQPPTPRQIVDAIAPSWSPNLPGGSGGQSTRPSANRQAGQGTRATAGEIKRDLDKVWSKLGA